MRKALVFLLEKLKSSSLIRELLYLLENLKQFTNIHAHEEMLADKHRCDIYFKGISKYIKKDDKVIDLGTGTGLLSFFAAKKEPSIIFALDHSEVIDWAKNIAKANNIANIEFVKKNSKDFHIDHKVDVIIHEQLGSLLFDENMVVNVLDLRDRLLKKGGRILPNYFELYIEPVKFNDTRLVPFIWNQKMRNIDYSCLKGKIPMTGRYMREYSRDPSYVDYFLCDPQKVYSCDLEKMQPDELPKSLTYKKEIKKSGPLHGFVIYFKGYFDDQIVFTNGPFQDRGYSWAFCLLRSEPSYFNQGDEIEFRIDIDSWIKKNDWRWQYRKIEKEEQ